MMLLYLTLPIFQAKQKTTADETQAIPSRYHNFLQETHHNLFTNASPAELNFLHRRPAFLSYLGCMLSPSKSGWFYYTYRLRNSNAIVQAVLAADYQFIPPLLHISASEVLINHLKRSLNVIKAKIKTIQGNNGENEQKLIEFPFRRYVFLLANQCLKSSLCRIKPPITLSTDSSRTLIFRITTSNWLITDVFNCL